MAEDAVSNIEKTFEHILISGQAKGPVLILGPKLRFQLKSKVPVSAVIKLVSNTNNIRGMADYIKDTMVKQADRDKFEELLEDIGGDGLGEIVEWITEVTSNLPLDSSND